MADTSGQTDNSMISHLEKHGNSYDFFQAVDQIQRLLPNCSPIGFDGPFQTEAIRFSPTARFTFAAGEIASIDLEESITGTHATVETTFLSLYGRDGVLPWHYTSQLRKEKKELHKEGMKKFLDIFNHRYLSYFYRAGTKYRTSQLRENTASTYFSALSGLATRGLSEKAGSVAPEIHQYAGLFSIPRSAESLETILKDLLKISLSIEEFNGEWVPLDSGSLTRIGKYAENNQIGHSFCVGRRVWSTQHKFRVIVGPVEYDSYMTVRPGTKNYQKLLDTIRIFASSSLVFDVQFCIIKNSLPGMVLGNREQLIGRSVWLSDDSSYNPNSMYSYRTVVPNETL